MLSSFLESIPYCDGYVKRVCKNLLSLKKFYHTFHICIQHFYVVYDVRSFFHHSRNILGNKNICNIKEKNLPHSTCVHGMHIDSIKITDISNVQNAIGKCAGEAEIRDEF